MKNAMVLEHHYGDDGNVTAGMILTDMTSKRFEELEKRGLVREATAVEVRAGHQHAFDRDTSESDDGGEKKAPAPSNKKAPEPANKAA